ncbi:competence type IV pilus minor pilin ComGD [uncultured Granulicatella sp.]|uniref:competence type IV pilus minor pilin ComGD n=1 Tax=uncultured Granulicatella sp. TaxID=316089 RepID=UPI0028D10482|nr:competence type IV pilus minor pilin ComGD [uncultured Granulicatella sp.]
MKVHAFTLVELLVSFSILIILLWLVPPAVVDFGETYQERVFIKQFENDLKLVQASAQATGNSSTVEINTPSKNYYHLSCPGNESLNVDREIPKSISTTNIPLIRFKGETGNITTFGEYPKIKFNGKKYSYQFTFQLGGGRYYVEVSKN